MPWLETSSQKRMLRVNCTYGGDGRGEVKEGGSEDGTELTRRLNAFAAITGEGEREIRSLLVLRTEIG